MKSADGCFFPEDRGYDVEHDLWFKNVGENRYLVGACQPFLFMTGRPKKVNVRGKGTLVRRNTAIALVVSSKMEGTLLSPVDLEILHVNDFVLQNPEVLADDPYGKGWLAEIACQSTPALTDAETASALYEQLNSRRGVVCFDIVPHYQITMFGESCESILTKIGDFMSQHVSIGETLYVVTQDPATEVDMINWAEKTGQHLLSIKRLGKTIHVIYKHVV
ncbi:MAG: hypothetical protein QW470_03580 [Candidatus Caldarchaeum sp.]